MKFRPGQRVILKPKPDTIYYFPGFIGQTGKITKVVVDDSIPYRVLFDISPKDWGSDTNTQVCMEHDLIFATSFNKYL